MFGKIAYIRGPSPLYASHISAGLRRFWDVEPILNPFRIPLWAKAYYALKTFKPNRTVWSQDYHYNSFFYYKKSSTFYKGTQWISRELSRHKKIDAIFQTGSYFLPSMEKLSIPYGVYIDFTTRLAEQKYPLWANFKNEKDKKEWMDIEGQVYHKADRIFTFIESARLSVINDYGVNPEKVITVGTGVIISEFPQEERDYDSRTIVFAGRDFDRHGGGLVLSAFEQVQSQVPDAKLVITATKIKTDNPGIHVLGTTSHAEVQSLLGKATVVVMPGDVGGLQTLTEAMAHRCVCIANKDNPHLDELIKDGETGYGVPSDPGKLAERIIYVLKHPEIQRRIGKRSSEHVRTHFTWPVVTEKISREMAKLL